VNRRRILSLWLPRLPTDRLGRSRAPADGAARPRVTVARQHNALLLVAVDAAAGRAGLTPGLPLASARAICPDLDVHDDDPAADARLLEAIADWCDRFTPLVARDAPHGLLLDVSGCAHLFGGEAALLRDLCDGLARQGFAVSAAIAATPGCARALRRIRHGVIVPPGNEAVAVGMLPVFALGCDDAVTRALRRAGLKTIGDVAARASTEITERFGAAFTAVLHEALGLQDAPISPRRPPPDYMVEKRFAEPVATDDAIMVALAALAERLTAVTADHGRGARRVEARFFRTDGLVRTVAVDMARPMTEPGALLRLFRERLDALADPLDPGFGFDLLRLSALVTEPVAQAQHDFDRHVHDDGEVAALVDRIAARLGGHRVVVYLPHDTHIPEHATIEVPAQAGLVAAARACWPAPIAGEPPLRPLRLLLRPEPVEVVAEVPDGPPARFIWRRVSHRVARTEGPERIAMEWWRHATPQPTRDYFRVEDEAGLRFWLYRDGLYARENLRPAWFMHGLFA
jgi:protein ImuB